MLGFGTTPAKVNTKANQEIQFDQTNLSVPHFNLLWLNKKLFEVWSLLFYPSVRIHRVDEEDRDDVF